MKNNNHRYPATICDIDLWVVGATDYCARILRGRSPRVLGFLKLRQVWIRIIYNTERNQQVTIYCCSSRISGEPESGCPQPKRLTLNELLSASIAWWGRGSRNSEYVRYV